MDGAVLGLGKMGVALAGRLLDAGHDLSVWNRSQGRADELTARGATEATSVADAVAGKDFVLVSLTGDDAVREVLHPDGQPVPGLDGVVIDCTTVSADLSREESEWYPDRFVACPIAGAPQAVEAGNALLIVGGAPDAIANVDPVLTAISESRHSAGDDPSTAAIMKLLNNYLLLAGLAALADTTATAQALGIADDDVRSLFNDLQVIAPGVKNRINATVGTDHEAWFSVKLGSKDLRLFADLADRAGLQLDLADAVRSRYEQAIDQGFGDADLSAVVETLRGDG